MPLRHSTMRWLRQSAKPERKPAKSLAASVTQHLIELGLDQAVFGIELIPLSAEEHRGRYGTESVVFSIRTNPDLEFWTFGEGRLGW